MPYVHSQDVRVHYEIEGSGPALLLQHGGIASIEVWRRCGYIKALRGSFQCILIDARGRGRSDKPHDQSAYSLELYVADIVAVLDALGIDTVDYWGYSMGGWIGFGMAKYAPERIHGMIIGGAHPFEDHSFEAFQRPDGADPDVFISVLEEVMEDTLSAEIREVLMVNDFDALVATMQSRTGVEDVLPTMTMPCLLYVGEDDARYDAIKTCTERMPNAIFASLPGMNHMQGMRHSELVLPHAIPFLEAIEKGRDSMFGKRSQSTPVSG